MWGYMEGGGGYMEGGGGTCDAMFWCSLERLILTCGLKGPCWLTIKQPSELVSC